MSISAPVIAFAIVGGFLGKVMAREDTYQHLKIFDDVVGLISSNYVEEVDIDKVMHGAMRGLADGLDPDSAYLSPERSRSRSRAATRAAAGRRRHRADAAVLPARHRGARQLAGREGRPAHRRLRPRDQRQADARDVGVGRHARAARRARLEGLADDHPRQRRRPARRRADARGRRRRPTSRAHRGAGHRLRAHRGDRPEHRGAGASRRSRICTKAGATKLIVDVRRTSGGTLDDGLALARLFVGKGTLAHARDQGQRAAKTIAAAAGDGAITLPTVRARSTPARRAPRSCSPRRSPATSAPTLIGEHTIGRAAVRS